MAFTYNNKPSIERATFSVTLGLSFGLLLSVSANALEIANSKVSFGTGIVNLSADEIVWDNDYGGEKTNELKSKLNWDTYWAPTAWVGYDTNFTNGYSISSKVAFATAGNSHMNDYDWLVYSSTLDDS